MGSSVSADSVNRGAQAVAQGLNAAAGTTAALSQGAANLIQTAGSGGNTLRLAMANMQGLKKGGARGGGCCDAEGFFGGDDTEEAARGLREYADSLSAKTKEDIIRRIARAMSRAGVKVDPEGDLADIVKALLTEIPNPSRNRKTFGAAAVGHEKICKTVAQVLNDEYTPGAVNPADMLIDTTLGAVEICRKVGEYVHGLATGVHTEFLAVHASVRNVMRNVKLLDQTMEDLWKGIRGHLEKVRDAGARRDLTVWTELYNRAQAERRRQEVVLANILDVKLAPAAKELEMAMREESERHALVEKLGLKVGTGEFGTALARAVSGLGSAASMAQRVHKALTEVGATVREYLDSKDYAEFRRLLDRKLESGAVPADKLAEFLEAMGELRETFDDRADAGLRAALEAPAGSLAVGGALDDDDALGVDTRVQRQRTEKRVILRDFAGRMMRHYNTLLAAVSALGPQLGVKIPLTEQTDSLRDALVRLKANRVAGVELALVGYYADADARAKKEQFLSALRLVEGACSALLGLEMYRGAAPAIAPLRDAVASIVRTIDLFSDTVRQKFGGDGEADGATGGDDDDMLPEIARSALSLNEAVAKFIYFYYVAKIRSNLAQTSKELASYGEKYVEVLGDAVAARLQSLAQGRKALLDHLAEAYQPPANDPGAAAFAAAFPATDAGKANRAKARAWIDEEYDVKAKFYRVVQAMDLYMKAFTAAIVGDPDAVFAIKKSLDGLDVIARWFSEETGDSLWKAFEAMGAVDFPGRRVAADPPAAARAVRAAPDGTHYYQRVAAAANAPNATGTFGVPQVGVSPDQGAEAKKNVASVFDNFQALKNLVNAFARIGDRFGGRDLHTQTFMSPAQIYRALIEYLKKSALSINAGSGAALPGAIPLRITSAGGTDAQLPAAVAPFQVYFGSVAKGPGAEPGLIGNYAIEDRYFVLVVKAMAAKILTTLGVYDMFERQTPVYELTPTRFIVGGADEAEPEVIDQAAELYFRLPRLAEFYRGFLRWDPAADAPEDRAAALRIAMLPELEGVFSGLIRIVFQKATSAASGDYSESELRALVQEINSIHMHFREARKSDANTAALSAFVMEINRRYGIIKRDDMAKYWAMVRESRKAMYTPQGVTTNYSILPGEDEAENDRRAPSDQFAVPEGSSSAGALVGRTQLDTGFEVGGARSMIRAFRAKLEKELMSMQGADFSSMPSYSLLFRQAEAELKRSTSREARLAVAAKLIQSTSVVGADANKSFMFHETVVVGLNTLGAIYGLIENFREAVAVADARRVENAVMDILHAGGAALSARISKDELIAASAPDSILRTPAYAALVLEGVPETSLASRGIEASHIDLYRFWAVEGQRLNLEANTLGAEKPSQYSEVETPTGLSEAKLRTLRGLRLFARFVVDYQRGMQTLVENLFDVTSQAGGLVEVRFQSGVSKIQVSFSKLRGVAESLLADVKQYLDIFRPDMPAQTIARFENQNNVGSVFWFESHLIDGVFRGQPGAPIDQPMPLEEISRRVAEIFQGLTRDTFVPYAGVTAASLAAGGAAITAPTAGNLPTRVEGYGSTFSGLIFYDASRPDSGQGALRQVGLDADYALGGLIRTVVNGARQPPTGAAGAVLERFRLYSDEGGMTRHRSLLFAFNQLLARYLAVVSDPTDVRKIYLNLINAFSNGVASRSVSKPGGGAFPDLAAAAEGFGQRGDPQPHAVVLQSLAYVLQRLTRDANPTTQISTHLVTTLADVPLYVKESFRVNLPGFVRLLELLSQKGEFIKQFMQKTGVDCARGAQLPPVGAFGNTRILTPAGGRVPGAPQYAAEALDALRDLDAAGLRSEDAKSRLVAVLDSISSAAFTLASAATDVLRELADAPVYLQTQEGSIQMYKERYGRLPLMPLSFALYYYRDLTDRGGSADDVALFPRHAQGEPTFKLQYGVRGLLVRGGPFKLEQLPSVRASLTTYNSVSSAREKLDEGRYEKFLGNVVATLRYAIEARNYKSSLSTLTASALFGARSLMGAGRALQDGRAAAAGQPALPRNTVYSIDAAPPDSAAQMIVTAVESSNQDEEAAKIAAVVGGAGVGAGAAGAAPGSRQQERILNLMDMNIVPINFHALMRGTALANLFNYEYTFEQMAAALYGEAAWQYTEQAGLTDADTRYTRQMFLRLLVQPYLDLDATSAAQGWKLYGSDVRGLGTAGFVHRIFRGDNDLGMGRPKFLSDQVFNKALFGSTFQLARDFDEAGPGVGSGVSRGHAGVGAAGWPPQTADWVAWPAGQAARTTTLSFLKAQASDDPAGPAAVVDIGIPGNIRSQLEVIGRLRFDTRLVRNIFFITNVLRLVRLKLNRELTQNRNVIASSHSAVAAGLTEYGADPFTPNEVLGSRIPGPRLPGAPADATRGAPRFLDED